ncbi:hypothetical protein ACQP2T_27110 [Nonomuraea sp. CA-143628]|uniref:hypothetical protein n=1 Tax=Nonomuraea sp. CA-143628 TaxID=3239997 RepID=UPI003D9152BF
MMTALGDLVKVIKEADPLDKADPYAQIGLRLTYRPQKKLVEAQVVSGPHVCKRYVSEDGVWGRAARWTESGTRAAALLTESGRRAAAP